MTRSFVLRGHPICCRLTVRWAAACAPRLARLAASAYPETGNWGAHEHAGRASVRRAPPRLPAHALAGRITRPGGIGGGFPPLPARQPGAVGRVSQSAPAQHRWTGLGVDLHTPAPVVGGAGGGARLLRAERLRPRAAVRGRTARRVATLLPPTSRAALRPHSRGNAVRPGSRPARPPRTRTRLERVGRHPRELLRPASDRLRRGRAARRRQPEHGVLVAAVGDVVLAHPAAVRPAADPRSPASGGEGRHPARSGGDRRHARRRCDGRRHLVTGRAAVHADVRRRRDHGPATRVADRPRPPLRRRRLVGQVVGRGRRRRVDVLLLVRGRVRRRAECRVAVPRRPTGGRRRHRDLFRLHPRRSAGGLAARLGLAGQALVQPLSRPRADRGHDRVPAQDDRRGPRPGDRRPDLADRGRPVLPCLRRPLAPPVAVRRTTGLRPGRPDRWAARTRRRSGPSHERRVSCPRRRPAARSASASGRRWCPSGAGTASRRSDSSEWR